MLKEESQNENKQEMTPDIPEVKTNKKWYKALWFRVTIALIVVVTGIAVASVALAKTDAEKAAYHLELGLKYLDELKYEKAVASFNKVLKLEPKNAEAVCGLAKAYIALEETDSAKNVLWDYINSIGNSKYRSEQEEAYALLADILYEQGAYDEVIRIIGHAVKRIDSDKDSVKDYWEILLGLNPKSEDSNEDGITDGRLVNELLLTDGIIESTYFPNCDSDDDGLINSEELAGNTNLFGKDTDLDGLTDYEELYYYGTNPVLEDTDEDGLFDGTEVYAGLNPNAKDSDMDGVPDGKMSFPRVIFMPSAAPDAVEVYPVAYADGAGEYYRKIDAVSVSENATLAGIASRLGNPFEFTAKKRVDNNVRIGFCVPAEGRYGNKSLENLRIASYDYENNCLVFQETEVIRQDDGSVLALTEYTESGTYMLINYNRFKNDINVSEESTLITSGKADIVFVLDITGSMGWAVNNVKKNIEAFTEYIREQGVDIRFGLVYYKDIYEDGFDSTQDKGFYYDYEEFLGALSDIDYLITGGGDNPETVVDALYVMKNMEFRAGVSKFAIVLTDEGYKNGIRSDASYTLERITGDLSERNICTSVVTCTENYYEYNSLVTGTGGELCDIEGSFMSELTPLMDKIGTIVQEGYWIRLSNGCVVNLQENPALGKPVDTDGDGIADIDELGELITVEYEDDYEGIMTYTAYTFRSNPALADSDGDGYMDAEDKNPIRSDVQEKYLEFKDSGYIDYNTPEYIAERMQEIISINDREAGVPLEDAFTKTKQLKKIFAKTISKIANQDKMYSYSRQICEDLFYDMGASGGHSVYIMSLASTPEEKLKAQMEYSIGNNLPVLLQSGVCGEVSLYADKVQSDSSEALGPGEWVLVTGYIQDAILNKTLLKVRYHDLAYYMDLEQAIDKGFMGAVIGLR
ncbi:MAG: tetratricopeptide repeat protein [Lachnospiraceae bacterium]|nr:tetratricopeptide repeat protein [Lachnospiraceae bacterium]